MTLLDAFDSSPSALTWAIAVLVLLVLVSHVIETRITRDGGSQ